MQSPETLSVPVLAKIKQEPEEEDCDNTNVAINIPQAVYIKSENHEDIYENEPETKLDEMTNGAEKAHNMVVLKEETQIYTAEESHLLTSTVEIKQEHEESCFGTEDENNYCDNR